MEKNIFFSNIYFSNKLFTITLDFNETERKKKELNVILKYFTLKLIFSKFKL